MKKSLFFYSWMVLTVAIFLLLPKQVEAKSQSNLKEVQYSHLGILRFNDREDQHGSYMVSYATDDQDAISHMADQRTTSTNIMYKTGTKVTLNAIPDEGYFVMGWYLANPDEEPFIYYQERQCRSAMCTVDPSEFTNGIEYIAPVFAKIETGMVKISFISFEGLPVSDFYVYAGETMEEPPESPVGEYSVFDGWYYDLGTFNNPVYFGYDTFDQNTTLYARFLQKIDTVSLEITPPVAGTSTKRKLIDLGGYGYYTSDPAPEVNMTVGDHIELETAWIKGTCVFNTNTNPCEEFYQGTFNNGVDYYAAIYFYVDDNYYLDVANLNLTITSNDENVQIVDEIPVQGYAVIVKLKPTPAYTVKFNTNGGNAIDDQHLVGTGQKATRPDDPTKKGYKFLGWYSNSALTAPYDFDSVVENNLTLYAKWTRNNVSIVSNPSSVDFDELPIYFATSVPKEITITNTSSVPVAISGHAPATSGPFGIIAFDEDQLIQPNESISVTLLANSSSAFVGVEGTYNGKYVFTATSQDGNSYTEIEVDAKVVLNDGQQHVSYTTHVQKVGWQDYVKDGVMAGTSGQALRLEGIKIRLLNPDYNGNIEYRTHIQKIGWEEDYKKNNQMSGTSGQALRLEAIQIRLTSAMADHYDIYYRVHAQKFGWLGWAKNGEEAGTAGYAYRLEGIEIKLNPKGAAFDGYGDAKAFQDKEENSIPTTAGAKPTVGTSLDDAHISYTTHVQKVGWQDYVIGGEMAGTEGKAYRLEGIKIKLVDAPYSGDIEYRTHIQTFGWESTFKKNDEMSGTEGLAKRLEAIEIKLTGEMAVHYDIYYCVHAQKLGWLGWAKNGEQAGTAGFAYRLEGIIIKLVPKSEEFNIPKKPKPFYQNQA